MLWWLFLALCFRLSQAVGDGGAVGGRGSPLRVSPLRASPLRASPLLHRQKRGFIWNRLYVEEEKETPIPHKIGKLTNTQQLEVKSFEIGGEGANTIFIVDGNGDLYVTRSLDREEKSTYKLYAKMYDGNRKLVEGPEDFTIHINDINDNRPVFPVGGYNASVAERSRTGTVVTQVKAEDADDSSTANAELRYTLRPEGDQATFQIDRSTGVISTKVDALVLDRETRPMYVLVVQAQDTGGRDTGSTATATVTIHLNDTNDNMASFTHQSYDFRVPEDHKLDLKIGSLQVEDGDQIQNHKPVFSIAPPLSALFQMETSGSLMLKQGLDYETRSSYSFSVHVTEHNLSTPADNKDTAVTKTKVNIWVLDVDEPPVFSPSVYSFNVMEETKATYIGTVHARDPDKANKTISYSIESKDCPIAVDAFSGRLSTKHKLDRETQATHRIQVKAQEEPSGLQAFVHVDLKVLDINDNKPELVVDDVFVCENDMPGTVIGTVRATDSDDQKPSFSFYLNKPNANFSLTDNRDNSASIRVKSGTFSVDDPRDLILEVGINDGQDPPLTSLTQLPIKVCRCDAERSHTHCKAAAARMGVSMHVLIAILLCILTILVIVILIVARRRYQRSSLSSLKHSGEIHEQLVSYDEEGGGEMDTNGYDVSILSCARQAAPPALYSRVQKGPPPAACKGDMALMIQLKKEEADLDRDAVPYDTLHIYGYEGAQSLAGSLSSLDSCCSSEDLGGAALDEWGPRFRTLAELYGSDASDSEPF